MMVNLYDQYYREYCEGKDYIDLRHVDNAEIQSALHLRVEWAIQRRVDAAYGGAMDDGGCNRTLDAIRSYVAGWQKVVPQWLEESIKERNRQTDPEYAKYLELKKRFE